jgi:hypothetical protein
LVPILFIIISFVLDIFFLFYPSIFCWMKISLCYFIRLVFCRFSHRLMIGSWILKVNMSGLFFFSLFFLKKNSSSSFNIWFIKNWSSYFSFLFFSIELSQSSVHGHRVNKLTRVDMNFFFQCFFFKSILSYNIRLFNNWVLWFYSHCF